MERPYVPRTPTTGVLYDVVRGHLSSFLAAVDERTDGNGLPLFVTREFRKFLTCGVLSRGFAPVRCGDCAFERLVPFSCKGRTFCPSCCGRRMTERAAHLMDHVLPGDIPVRQWVLSVPHALRYRLAYNHTLCRAVVGVYVRTLFAFYRERARRAGVEEGQTGTVTGIQRFGGSVNLHVHAHTLVLDGVFVADATGQIVFHPAPPPTDDEVAQVAARVRRRLERGLRLQGIGDEMTDDDTDLVADWSVTLRRLIGDRVKLKVEHGRALWPVMADPNRIGNALMNLSINARDAMANGGTLTIRTANVSVEETKKLGQVLMPSGDYVTFEVEDELEIVQIQSRAGR